MAEATHVIREFDQLRFVMREGKADEYVVARGGYRVRLLSYPNGGTVDMHAHTDGDVHKLILRGKVVYDERQELQEGSLATIEKNVRYTAVVEPGTLVLLLEPERSHITLG